MTFSAYFFTGFTQHRSGGLALLRDRVGIEWPEATPYIYGWDEPSKPIAAEISADIQDGKRIVIVAYSYGAGHQAKDVCEIVGSMGLDIGLVCYIDPVICKWPFVLNAICAGPRTPFPVPANVQAYGYWLQTNRRMFDPKPGWPTPAEFSKTECLAAMRIEDPCCGHSEIDNWPSVHNGVIDVIRSWAA